MDSFIANGGWVTGKTKTIYPISQKWFAASAGLLVITIPLTLTSILIAKCDVQDMPDIRWLVILCGICASYWFVTISLLLSLSFLIMAFYYRKTEEPKVITIKKDNPAFDARKLY